ncbi:hypothetical protein [Dokdonia sp.]|uniref:hypothetical protein n=1 Tax=Dokdonia sp. TaxID=2024995 RepID=UPI003266D555
MNTGNNTAENVELHIRILKDDKIMFVPDIFNHVKGENKEGLAGNLFYKCDKIVPGERVRIYVFSNYKNYLKTHNLDTLIYNKRIDVHKPAYGPNIINLKHSLGKVEIQRQNSILLRKLNY